MKRSSVLIWAAMSVVSQGASAQNAPQSTLKGTLIWREGEAASRSTLVRHPWWYDKVDANQLSGGAWMSQFTDKNPGVAEYDLSVPKAGDYHLWLRANPTQSKLSMQLNNGAWTTVDTTKTVGETINVAEGAQIDLRFVAWMDAGTIKMPMGASTLRFKMESANNFHGALDCFVLTDGVFVPNGKNKPGEAPPVQQIDDAQSWPFAPFDDPFKADAALDLRYLNEKVAGEHGFVRLSADGNDFVRGDGQPLRFWAGNTTIARGSDADMRNQARFLAKQGVNLVRMHGSFSPKAKDAKITDADQEEIERCWKLVAAMKAEGIYTTISPFWANGGHAGVKASWGIPGYGDGDDIWGLMFFDKRLRDAYKSWVRAAYLPKNPHTGVSLAQDPSVAIIQIQNEDSLFFWTLGAIKPAELALLQDQFAAWLAKKYGSLDKAREAWQNAAFPRDDWAKNHPDIDVWRMTQPQTGGATVRIRDQIQFLAEVQREFYVDITRFYRDELGCKQLVNACNWYTADGAKLNDIERWTYTPTDVVALNKYVNGGPHLGADNGWKLAPGQTYQGSSVLFKPLDLPTAAKQVSGHPMIITESSWVPPLAYQSEGPFLIAAYQSLSGVDGYYWFSIDKPFYQSDPFLAWDRKSQFKWSLPPAAQTLFPACALMYRRGDIKQAPVIVHEERSLPNLLDRTPPLLSEGKSFDPNHKGDFAEGTPVQSEVDPLAFLAGRVEVKYEGDPKKTRVQTISKFIDAPRKTITSSTGELKWNYGDGLCTLDAPRVQGATGFLNKFGTLKMKDISISSQNDYATMIAIALDDKTLASSSKVLLQIGTVMRPTGWQETEGEFPNEDGKSQFKGHKIVSTGTLPYRVVNTKATLTIHNAALKTATLLDANGYRLNAVAVKRAGADLTIILPPNAMSVLIEG